MSETDPAAPPKRPKPWPSLWPPPWPIDEIWAATLFLTRLPIPWPGTLPDRLVTRAMAWYPLIGAGLGLAAGLLDWAGRGAGLSPALAGLLALLAQIWATGALHEDGLADFADGVGGGRDPAARLAIMRDSRLGSYGVLALILAVGLRLAAILALGSPAAVAGGLAAAGGLSRAALPFLGRHLPPARPDGLGARFGAPDRLTLARALVLALILAIAASGRAALPAIALAVLSVLALAGLARRRLGGQTGDVLGAGQQVAEIAALLALCAAQAQP